MKPYGAMRNYFVVMTNELSTIPDVHAINRLLYYTLQMHLHVDVHLGKML